MTFAVELPWPSNSLHPNSRVHWSKRAKAAKKARFDAMLIAKVSGAMRYLDDRMQDERIPVALTFHPPDKRRRDVDGMLSALKSSLDGLADALMVNDNLFDLTLKTGEPMRGGRVIVEIL